MVVSTDDPEIAVVSQRAGAEVVWRPAELSSDYAPSEAALLHALQVLGISEGALAFIQCTAPLLLPADIDGTVAALHGADSAFTATPAHRFLWRSSPEGAVPLGHDRAARPLRQQMAGEYMEVGAVYAVRIERFLSEKTRFAGRSAIYPLPRSAASKSIPRRISGWPRPSCACIWIPCDHHHCPSRCAAW